MTTIYEGIESNTSSNSTLNDTVQSSGTAQRFYSVYYLCLDFVMGFLSTIANGLLLMILTCFNRNRRQTTNVLIVNQVCMDLFTGINVMIAYVPNKTRRQFPNNRLGLALCDIFNGTILLYIPLTSSVIGLTVIAIERYVKIVHSVTHRKYYRSWMTKYLVALPWIFCTILVVPAFTATTTLIDGYCYPMHYFPSPGDKISLMISIVGTVAMSEPLLSLDFVTLI